MSAARRGFAALTEAMASGEGPSVDAGIQASLAPLEGAGLHKPMAALGTFSETLRERVRKLEGELANAGADKAGLEAEVARLRSLSGSAAEGAEQLVFLDPGQVVDLLPSDRLPKGSFEQPDFEDLLADIRDNGQNDAITVRPAEGGKFEVAAGRRRLEACRRLNQTVLARVRQIDDTGMLRVQYSENERRKDISALERARWFAAVRDRTKLPAKQLAAEFGIDKSTLSMYFRVARFPEEIIGRLVNPGRLGVIPARRVMEAIEADAAVVPRILAALEAHRLAGRDDVDEGAAQVEVLMRAAENRMMGRGGQRPAVPERRHIVHEGRRIGTLSRSGGQWLFRFATSISDGDVQVLAERLAAPVKGS